MVAVTMPASPTTPSLYDRIGGRTKLLELLRYFYADVRQQAEIGPIFAAHVADWPAHLENIADFWSGITGGPARYGGGMPMKHFPLGLEERHFDAWLGLWARQCRIRLQPQDADDLIAVAESIGQRLRAMIAAHGVNRAASG